MYVSGLGEAIFQDSAFIPAAPPPGTSPGGTQAYVGGAWATTTPPTGTWPTKKVQLRSASPAQIAAAKKRAAKARREAIAAAGRKRRAEAEAVAAAKAAAETAAYRERVGGSRLTKTDTADKAALKEVVPQIQPTYAPPVTAAGAAGRPIGLYVVAGLAALGIGWLLFGRRKKLAAQ